MVQVSKAGEGKNFFPTGILLFLLVLVLIFLDLLTGSMKLGIPELFSKLLIENDNSVEWLSLHEFRIPRLVTSLIAGIGLSISGLQMQTVFRNPLAGPYVLGISAGAGLGVALLVLGLPGLFTYSVMGTGSSFLLIIAACIGAASVLFLMLILSFRIRNVMTILILGIMLASGISAIISILQYFSQESALKAFVIWTLGSLSGVTSAQLPYMLIGFIPGIIIAIFIIKPSNAMMLGENYARSIGVKIVSYRILLFTSTALLTGTVTAFCGPIGFVGIAVPHLARMITGTSRFGVLLFFSILTGASIMLISDILSQLPGSDLILPINAVTSLIGIPVVIWIVTGRKNIYT
ncbi:MAG: FecCD family ABC transporter permease [Bacteroidales bacterium]